MKTGKLYVIGVGPGDPELLTIKGMRILTAVTCICVPKGREEGSSLALSIIEKVVQLKGKEIIEAHFPMKKTKGHTARGKGLKEDLSPDKELSTKWDETVKTVSDRLNRGTDMAFITIGDPTIYSTFFYLYERLLDAHPDLDIEIIPGVSSINASAARAKISLGLADEKIAVLPATYIGNLKETLEKFDTVVLMKVHKVLGKVVAVLEEMGLTSRAVYVSRAGMCDEEIIRDISTLKEGEMNYFSLVIIRK